MREKVWGMHAHGLMSACVNACVCLCAHVSVHGRDVVGLSQSPEGRRRTNAPKNSPWAAGVHSLSAVRPWGQGGREEGMEGERGCERE